MEKKHINILKAIRLTKSENRREIEMKKKNMVKIIDINEWEE